MTIKIWQRNSDANILRWCHEDGAVFGHVGVQPSEFVEAEWTLLPYRTSEEYQVSLPRPKTEPGTKEQYAGLIAAGVAPDVAARALGL